MVGWYTNYSKVVVAELIDANLANVGSMRSTWETWQSSQIEISDDFDGFGFKSVTFQCNFIQMMVVLVNQLNFHWNFRRMMVVLVNQWIFRSNQQWCRGVWYLRQSPDKNIESRKIKRWGFCTISPSWSILSTSTIFAPKKLICMFRLFLRCFLPSSPKPF